jgi:hypothetical protein
LQQNWSCSIATEGLRTSNRIFAIVLAVIGLCFAFVDIRALGNAWSTGAAVKVVQSGVVTRELN